MRREGQPDRWNLSNPGRLAQGATVAASGLIGYGFRSPDDPELPMHEEPLPDPQSAAIAEPAYAGFWIRVGAELIDDSLAATSGLVDVTSLHELAARHEPSPWGRLDLAVAWRRIEFEAAEPRRTELWLVATWRN